MTRKRIAVLLAQPEEYNQERFLKGFLKEAFERDYDVCIFAMYIKFQNTHARCTGESSIYRMISFDKFDAVVVMADTIQTEGEVAKIERRLRTDYHGKVLFVNQDSKFFPSIHTNNYQAEKQTIAHLIEKHGMRDIAFLAGKSWHPHSMIRLQAYKDALTEHGIEVDEERIFFGDFWYTSGESLADTLTSSDRKLPEAVACANDCMAIGLAKKLTQKGLSIPDDIAIVGCDSLSEGRHSPVPVTSAYLECYTLGQNAALTIHAYLEEEEPQTILFTPKLFIGGTCGCGCDSAKPTYELRDKWDNDISINSMFSPINHMEDDLLGQSSFTGLLNTIFLSLPFIIGFASFDLCLNPSLGSAEVEFEDTIRHAISCKGKNNYRILTDSFFARTDMLPALYEEREQPAAYFFMPLHYEDSIFGYAAVSYGNRLMSVSPQYRAWLKSVCRGIEFYRRSDALIGSSKIAKTGVTIDNLTGLRNYRGFLEQSETLLHLMRNTGGYMGALAIDIKGLAQINDKLGRKEGDKVIILTANSLEMVFSNKNSMCIRIGNDEMVAIRRTRNPDDEEILAEKDRLLKIIDERVKEAGIDCPVEFFYGIQCGSPSSSEEMERLVNVAISKKNVAKANAQKLLKKRELTEKEIHDAKVVSMILDDNKLLYHFQPIVEVRTGRIYAYEALMRADVTPFVSPLEILRYAEYYDRLYDVERATFFNVLRLMQRNESKLSGGKKIFINSIAGCMLNEEDSHVLEDFVKNHPDSVVVELTERSEISDEDLSVMKEMYERMNIKTAVDDYGSGFSNISNLLRYSPDYVKIDRSLLTRIEESPQKQHFVRDIIQFSHENGILALAEGVETEEELKTVVSLGVDLIQGYYTARPEKELIQTIDAQVALTMRKYAALKYQGTES